MTVELVLLLCALFSLVLAEPDADFVEVLKVTVPHVVELFIGTALIFAGLYLNYFGRSIFIVFIYLAGAALGSYSSVLIGTAVASHYGIRKDPFWLLFSLGILGAGLGSFLLRKLWKFATAAVGAFAGKMAVMLAFTFIPEAVYLDAIVRLVLLFFGGLIGGILAVKLERHAVIVSTAIFGTFIALFGYDTIRHLNLADHFKNLLNLEMNESFGYVQELTANQELQGILVLSVFVIVTGIYTQYRITPKNIDRD